MLSEGSDNQALLSFQEIPSWNELKNSLKKINDSGTLILNACNEIKKLLNLKTIFLFLRKRDGDHKDYLEISYQYIDPQILGLFENFFDNIRDKVIQLPTGSIFTNIYNDRKEFAIFDHRELQMIIQESLTFNLNNKNQMPEILKIPSFHVYYVIPIVILDKMIGHLGFFHDKEFMDRDLQDIRQICDIIAGFFAKNQFNNTLSISKENISRLFDEMKNGFALCRMISDQKGEAVDFSFLEMNTAFENITGLKKEKALGKTVLELIPQTDPFWIKAYGEVAFNNKSLRFEQYFEITDKYFEIVSFSPWNDLFATIYTDITEKKQIVQQLSDVLELNQTIIKASVFGIIAINDSGFCILANQAAAEIFDESVEKLLIQNFNKMEYWINSGFKKSAEEVLSNGDEKQTDIHLVKDSGIDIWLDCFFSRFKSKGKPHLLLIINDITERKRAENMLKMSEERLKLALFAANQGLYDTNLKTGEMIVSPEYARMLGFDSETFLENYETWVERMHDDDRERVETYYQSCLNGEILTFHIEFRQKTKSGQWRWILSQGNIVEWDNEGSPLRLMGTHTDISDRKKMEEELIQARIALEEANRVLEKLSNTDALTGIANRRYFSEVFEKEWYRAKRNSKPISLIMMDIDFFKLYNDYYGHLKGDDCLKSVAMAINHSVRRTTDITARYGGEEFVTLLPDTNLEGAKIVAENIHENIERLQIEHLKSTVNRFVSVSLGIATILPIDNQEYTELIEKADKALYKAKEMGRNRFYVYKKD